MKTPITITATIPAWLPSHEQVDSLFRLMEQGHNEEAANLLVYSTAEMDKGSNPWARAGEANITVTIVSRDALVTGQVAALKKELENERAETMQRQNAILDRIGKLQALEYVEPAA